MTFGGKAMSPWFAVPISLLLLLFFGYAGGGYEWATGLFKMWLNHRERIAMIRASIDPDAKDK